MRRLMLVSLALAIAPSVRPAVAQTSPDVQVTWQPERPVQGTLFRLIVRVSDPADVLGMGATLAGETLHFHARADGVREALAAAPLNTGAKLELPLLVMRRNGVVDTVRVTIPVDEGEYRMEKLTVAPQFGAPPDSATAARIASEQAKAMRVSRRSHATPLLLGDTVIRPRDSRITSGFGDGRQFNGQVQSRHTGLDFAGTIGAPVYAAARGVVALVDSFFLAGNVIYIDHGEGLVTAYFHLSRQDVAAGDTVEAGQVIGRVGATGRVTGPHLHFVTRFGRITISPESFLSVLQNRDGA
ncbi:MAG: M23 family metallopeptidase [Gemmatimonadota bacterium]|jgi:murein DD-endopeptidase MepM/ murein hydrolase activator NlpD